MVRPLDRRDEVHDENLLTSLPEHGHDDGRIRIELSEDELTLALLNIAIAQEDVNGSDGTDEEQAPPSTTSAHMISAAHITSPAPASAPAAPTNAREARAARRMARTQAPVREDSETRRKATRSSAGKRRQRRWQNQCFLHSLAHRIDEVHGFTDDEGNVSYPEAEPSAFTSLLSNHQARETWTKFSELPLRKQSQILAKRSPKSMVQRSEEQARFFAMPHQTRNNLKRQALSVDAVCEQEEAVLYILAHTGVFEATERDGRRRTVLYALAQYHDLECTSSDKTKEGRVVRVAGHISHEDRLWRVLAAHQHVPRSKAGAKPLPLLQAQLPKDDETATQCLLLDAMERDSDSSNSRTSDSDALLADYQAIEHVDCAPADDAWQLLTLEP